MTVEQRKKSTTAAANDQHLLGGTAIKPAGWDRTGWEAVRYKIYNPETGAIMTRTPRSWALITLFYCIYYSCLAAFWYGMLTLFLSFVSDNQPRYTLTESLIGINPGVGLQPGQSMDNIDSSMFFLRRSELYQEPHPQDIDGDGNLNFAARYGEFLEKNYPNRSADGTEEEDYQTVTCGDERPEGNVSCLMDLSLLGNCGPKGKSINFGYTLEQNTTEGTIKPCILLKPNRIFDWVPRTFDGTVEEDVKKLEEMGAPESVLEQARSNPGKLYVDCQGENTADREALRGAMQYLPGPFFEPVFFPFDQVRRDSKGRLFYQSPLVAVQFDAKKLPKGQLLHVECKLWHKDAEHERKDRKGLVHFEIIFEN